MDLWAQVCLLDSVQRLEETVTAHREHYFEQGKRNRKRVFSYMLKIGAEELNNIKLKDIGISLLVKNYLALPEPIDYVRYIKLDKRPQDK